MDNLNNTDKQFRVVRYQSEPGLGLVEEVLGSHLTLDEAEKIAKDNPAIVSDESVEIEEETLDLSASDENISMQ